MRKFYRFLRLLSAITLFFFCWTFLPLWQIAAWAAEPAKSRKTDPSQSPLGKGGSRGVGATSGERFEKALEAIRENVDRLEKKHVLSGVEGADKGEDDAKEREIIKSKRAEIESADGEFRKEFAATEKKLKDAKLPQEILDRHAKFVKHYEDNLKELKTNLDAIEKPTAKSHERRAAFTKAKAHLDKTKTPSKHVPLDPNKLPHRMVKGKERAPRLKKEEFERDFPRQKKPAGLRSAEYTPLHSPDMSFTLTPSPLPSRERDKGRGGIDARHGGWAKHVLLAYNATIASDMPLELPLPEDKVSPAVFPLPSFGRGAGVRAGEGWGEGMMTPSKSILPDFVFSDSNPQSEIRTSHLMLAQATVDLPTADDLSETPEVQFMPEILSLAAQLGNNPLRIYETIRNNYKYEPYYGSLKGAQQTLREKAGNDFDLASLLISLYRSAGIPARYVVATISMPLTQAQNWLGLDDPKMVGRLLASAGVPVAVDYLAGNIRIEHVLVQAWVPYQNGRGALNGPGDTWVYMDPSFKEAKVTQILNQTIPSFDQTQYLGQLRAEDPAEYYSGLIQEYLNTTSPGRTSYAVARHSEIVPLSLGILIGMPQYDIITAGGHFQEIPDQYRYKIAFELTEPELLEASLFYQKSTAELAGKRITLSYSPATSQDQSLINIYGDIYSTPAYLVNLKPELKIEGTSVAQGLSLGFGNTQAFRMKFISPGGYTEQIENSTVSGAYYAIALDLQTVTQGMVFERTQKLQAMNDFIATGGTATLDDHAGELLYSTALTYFQKLDAANRKAQELLRVNDLRAVSEAIFSIDVKTASLFGVPKSVDVSGVHIDVDRDIHLPIPVDGNTEKIKEYNLLIGSSSSYFEHKIIEDIYPTEGISAVKGLQIANEQGNQIVTINSGNVDAILPTLQVRSEIKTDIINAVNAEKEVIVPQQEITLHDWRGVSYIAMNPQTGEAAYMISGGLAGGDSTIPLTAYVKATALSGNVAADKEMAAIENSIERDYIIFPGPDNSIGSPEALRLFVVDEFKVTQPITGPPNTQCAGKFWDTFRAPDYDLKAPLLDIGNVLDRNLSENITVYDYIGNSGSSLYGRISSGFIQALDYYIQTLKDLGIEPTISSGYRTWLYNCTVPNSVINSNHIDGIASDVEVGATNQAVAARLAMKMIRPVGGVGFKIYNTIVHVDLEKPRDW